MAIEIQEKNGKIHVSIAGRLDTVSSHEFEKQIKPLTEIPQPDIAIDCSNFDYISSSGLRQFLILQKAVIANKGTLVINNLKPEIKEVFDMTGFTSIFTINPE
ncbi:anti-anti-sigma factor [Dysgonomonadaceae bacterium PH5-43]|nr:anti-anti-sigma factor [Dysgonomonadaceae bacterium PH5-43]